jgi:uncharacterized protein YijF (DUF1287 family)
VNAEDVTPLREGDTVSWRTATGYRTGGVIHSILDDKTARVRTHRGAHSSFGLVTIGLAKLERADVR